MLKLLVQRGIGAVAILGWLLAAAAPASAHRPVWGEGAANGVMPIENLSTSFAFYRDLRATGQAEVYTFEAKAGEHLHAGINIPAIPGLENYGVSIALLGPGLPEVNHDLLPENHPEDLGGLIFPTASGADFYEPFTQTNYWGRQRVELDLSQTGSYYLLVWQPQGLPGKYVLDTGSAEVFGPADLLAFPGWWIKVHMFFGESFYGLEFGLAAATMMAVAAVAWFAWQRRRKLAPQQVRAQADEPRC